MAQCLCVAQLRYVFQMIAQQFAASTCISEGARHQRQRFTGCLRGCFPDTAGTVTCAVTSNHHERCFSHVMRKRLT